MITEIVFDVETQKLFSEIPDNDPGKLGVSIISLYIRSVDESHKELNGTMMSFWEHEIPGAWEHFRKATRIIGFNSVKFDVPALAPYLPKEFPKLPHFDIMEHVRGALGHNLSLNVLAQSNLGTAKTDNGLNAVDYWRSQDAVQLAKLKAYCEADVMVTTKLYDFGFASGKYQYMDKWNTKREFPVDFSYPKSVLEASRQIGLF